MTRRLAQRVVLAIAAMVVSGFAHLAFLTAGTAAAAIPCVVAENDSPYVYVEVCPPLLP